MKSAFDITADLDTPVSAYLKLAPFAPRFLLESVERGERIGRYSFIGFGDGLRLAVGPEQYEVDGTPHPLPATTDALLAVMRDVLAQAPVPGPAIPNVPFAGGLVGYSSYEMNRRFDGPRTAAHRRI